MPTALESLTDFLPSLLASDEIDYSELAHAFAQIATWLDALAQMPPALRTRLLPPLAAGLTESPPVHVAAPPPEPEPVPKPEPALAATIPAVLPGHRFQRALRGGYLSSGARVPESVVRDENLRTGDRVTATPFPDDPMPGRYRFAVVARDPDPDARERAVVSMVLLDRDGDTDRLVARKILADGETLDPPLAISEEDVSRLDLRAGDVVDLAYWVDDPTGLTVAWRYRDLAAPPDPKPVAVSAPAPAPTAPRTKSASSKALPVEAAFAALAASGSATEDANRPPSPLSAHRVLVVGCPPKHGEYQAAVETCGGLFEGATGDESQDRLEAAVQRSDVVVILKKMLSHQAVNDAKAFAKKHRVAYRVCGSLGIQTVVDRAATALAKKAMRSA